MIRTLTLASLVALTLASIAFADDTATIPPSCKRIEEACLKAGFIQGAVKKGDGLWADCIDPIMHGMTTVPGATKPLPEIEKVNELVAHCRARAPKWGEGEVGPSK
jgi:hypothetical protein